MAKLAGAHFYPACMTGAKLACCMHASLTGNIAGVACMPASRVNCRRRPPRGGLVVPTAGSGIHGGAEGIYLWAPRFNYIYTLVNNVSSIIDGFPFCSNIVALLCLDKRGREQKAGPGHLEVARWTPHARQESQASFTQRPEQLKPVFAHTRPPRGGEVPRSLLKMA
ncbi:hypothetical protein V6N12_068961 [Hibiscus sabdariffa]|uniref:Uncharacterized protein n=1 Tax=Hibiscus sabdariffa TaxID=183260 RepID=A0ABR2CAA4_9ROSI